MFKTTTLLLALGFLCTTGIAQDFYVSTGGTDDLAFGRGESAGDPWRTLTFAAANASTGATINVATGTYGTAGNLEGIEITGTKTLSFKGTGSGTIVKAHAAFSPTIKTLGGVLRAYHGVFIVHGSSAQVNVSSMVIDGSNLAATRLACMVYSDGASGTVKDCDLINAGAATSNGEQHNVGFLAIGKSAASASKVTLDGCRIEKWNKVGVAMMGDGLTGLMVNCTVIGGGRLGAATAAQSGVQLGPGGARYTMMYNEVRDLWYTSTAWNSPGVVVYNTSTADNAIACNTFVSCKTAYFHSSPTGSTKFKSNHVRNCKWGVAAFTSGASITSNHFDADISVFVDSSFTATLNKNSYSDLRCNAGYPDYRADGNLLTIDTNVKTSCVGFNAPVNVAAARPNCIVTGDFNGDSKPDFASANTTTVSIHLGNGGTSFGGPTFVSSIGTPLFLTTGQFTTGSSLDLAVISEDGTLRILKNNGLGVFSTVASESLDIDGAVTSSNPTSIAAGNFNGAGELDVVVGFAGKPSDGPAAAYWCTVVNGKVTGKTLLSGTHKEVNGVASGDISGNGATDIVLMDQDTTTSKVRVYVQSSSTAGTFAAPLDFPIGADGHGVAVGDLNTDGKPDVVATRAGTPGWVHVFENIRPAIALLAEPTSSPFRVDSGPTECEIVQPATGAKLDVAVVHPSRAKVTILRSYSGGKFTDFRGCHVGKNPSSLAFAFLDAPTSSDDIDMLVAEKGDVSETGNVAVFGAIPLTALFEFYGAGCPGYMGQTPVYVSTAPRLGDLTWSIGITNGRPLRPTAGVLSVIQTPSATPCDFQINLGVGAFFAVCCPAMTDATGKTTPFVIGVPNCPEFAGGVFYSQWGVQDGMAASNYPPFRLAMTPGVKFRIGLQ